MTKNSLSWYVLVLVAPSKLYKMVQDCFINNNGQVYKGESLRKAAEDLPIIEYQICSEEIFEELIHWQLKNFRDFLVHYQRVTDADLSKPIILRSDGCIMDGWHRVIKAIREGKISLQAKKFIIDPQPDY